MDVLGPLAALAEKLFGDRSSRRAVDTRIADRAVTLCRTLRASFESWPQGPQTLDELTAWARKFAQGFPVTEPERRDLVDLRSQASRKVRQAVGAARDAYYTAADVVNQLVGKTYWGPLASPEGGNEEAVQAKLRRAFARVRQCVVKLVVASETKD